MVTLTNAVEGMLAMWLPLNVANLYVVANNSISGVDMYAQNYAAPSADNFVYDSSSVVDNQIDMECYTPVMGWFYILIEEGNGNMFNSTIWLNYTVCPAGMGGYNCAFPLRQFNLTWAMGPHYINWNQTSLNDEGPFDYYYLDFAPNTTLSVYLNTTVFGTNTVYYRRNGFPEYSSDLSDLDVSDDGATNSFDFYWQSLFTGGRYFIGIQNRDYVTINYTLGYGAGPAPSTTGSSTGSTGTTGATSTSGSSTGMTTTTTSGNDTSTGEDTTGMTTSEVSTTSSASMIAASIAVVVVALAAMF